MIFRILNYCPQISEIEKLQKSNKEKDNLEFKDQQKVNDFLERQKKQDNLMKEFAEKMKDNLDKFKTDKKDEFKDELQKRLEKAQSDIEKNKKLLDELKELNDKIKNEELLEKLDQFLSFNGREKLDHYGKISHQQAENKAKSEYKIFKKNYIDYQTPVERHFAEAIKDVKQIDKQQPRKK